MRGILDDKGFVGRIGLRWQAHREGLPGHVRGHIGYAVVPRQRRRGYATRAWGLVVAETREVGAAAS